MKEFALSLVTLKSQLTVVKGLKKQAIERRKRWEQVTANSETLRLMQKKEDQIITKREKQIIELTRAIKILDR